MRSPGKSQHIRPWPGWFVGSALRSIPAAARRALSSSGGGDGDLSDVKGVGTYEAVLRSDTHGDRRNRYSAVITQRKTQGAGQAQLYATDVGKLADGMNKPQVGIASVWYEGNPQGHMRGGVSKGIFRPE